MINVQCSKLEDVRKNPAAFAKKLAEDKESGGIKKGMFSYWQDAVRFIHLKEMTLLEAKDFLVQEFKAFSTEKKNLLKQEFLLDRLEPYINEYEQRRYNYLESRKNIKWPITTTTILTGQTPFCVFYAKTLSVYFFTENPFNWRVQLRFPLLQEYLLKKYSKHGIQEVEIGIYCLETNSFQLKTFSKEEIETALKETKNVFNNVTEEFTKTWGKSILTTNTLFE